MYALIENPKEKKYRSIANFSAQTKSNGKQGLGFVDSRRNGNSVVDRRNDKGNAMVQLAITRDDYSVAQMRQSQVIQCDLKDLVKVPFSWKGFQSGLLIIEGGMTMAAGSMATAFPWLSWPIWTSGLLKMVRGFTEWTQVYSDKSTDKGLNQFKGLLKALEAASIDMIAIGAVISPKHFQDATLKAQVVAAIMAIIKSLRAILDFLKDTVWLETKVGAMWPKIIAVVSSTLNTFEGIVLDVSGVALLAEGENGAGLLTLATGLSKNVRGVTGVKKAGDKITEHQNIAAVHPQNVQQA
ncbi:hypothetical protein PCIT_b1177 [Pseudoalteromonas citrea]|uniref:Uncharacterized protein n=2 Tax=Pseudoalteromonas citrea TaxID=43655 RepID=A0AAD4AFS6_9GAMM|nr:hypothetical protein [Pseudoalteromonas citrea]KAF7765043.1 hypothetical protein PCIT_b1177 [Pseudoalteromonas citrea]